MPIDPSQVTWDAAPNRTGQESDAQEIKPSEVQWDPDPAPQAAPSSRGLAAGFARQVGLTARHGLEGLGQAAEVFTEPVAGLMRAGGMPTMSTGQLASKAADAMGLPQPEDQTERVVGDAARFVAGAGGMAGTAARAAQALRGPLQSAAQMVAANPGLQAVGAAGAGAGAGVAREAGGGDGMQLAAGLAGGVAAGGLAGGRMAQAAQRLMPAGNTETLERQIEQALAGAGVNWQDVPERIRQTLRAEASRAASAGDGLNGAALSRLMDFERVGATPTQGTLSLDPVQITREQNLARMGANATDSGLHGLARVQNENNGALIEAVNRLGVADDAHAAGERVIGALRRGLDTDKSGIDALYSQARDSAGRSFPLDGKAFTAQASRLLDDALLGGALPSSVSQHLNRIAQGEVPFTVDYAEQLKTAMGKIQRATSDGQTRMALGLVRQALDDAPVLEMGRSGPAAGARAVGSSLPYAGGTEIGEQALEAFSRARLANADMMRRVERIPGLKAVYEGKAAPDDFVQRHVIGRGAKVADVQHLARELERSDPQALQAVRGSIAAHLKTAAIGAASDETGKFSASGFNRAMLALGSKKLAAFFSPEEVQQIKAIGKVAQYTTAQPAGSAVNNSNSGALLMGRGLDLLDRLSAKVPLLGVGPTISGVTRGMQQRQSQNIAPALIRRYAPERRAPAATLGALMAETGDER